MRVFRFMGYDEIEKYLKDKKLVNNTIHKGKTNSVGFCFLDASEYDWKKSYEFLKGVVDDDFLAIFETNKKLNKTYGIYATPLPDELENASYDDKIKWLDNNFGNTMTINEYCTTSYSSKDFKLVGLYKSIRNEIAYFIVEDWLNLKELDKKG